MPKKYRPSNGTEGMDFMDKFCDRCWKEESYRRTQKGTGCKILCKTMVYDINDPEYPEEWTYDEDGNPTCTEFESVEEVMKRIKEKREQTIMEKEKNQIKMFRETMVNTNKE